MRERRTAPARSEDGGVRNNRAKRESEDFTAASFTQTASVILGLGRFTFVLFRIIVNLRTVLPAHRGARHVDVRPGTWTPERPAQGRRPRAQRHIDTNDTTATFSQRPCATRDLPCMCAPRSPSPRRDSAVCALPAWCDHGSARGARVVHTRHYAPHQSDPRAPALRLAPISCRQGSLSTSANGRSARARSHSFRASGGVWATTR